MGNCESGGRSSSSSSSAPAPSTQSAYTVLKNKTDAYGRAINSERRPSIDIDYEPELVPTHNKNGNEQSNYNPVGVCVFLNIYDLHMTNLTTERYGLSAFHTGVEIYDEEYSFAPGGPGQISIMRTPPFFSMGSSRFKESLYVGRSLLTKDQVKRLRLKFAAEPYFPSSCYDLFSRNCNHFSEAFIRELTDNPEYEVPTKISRIVNIGNRIRCCFPQAFLKPHLAAYEEYQMDTKHKSSASLLTKSFDVPVQHNGGSNGSTSTRLRNSSSTSSFSTAPPTPIAAVI